MAGHKWSEALITVHRDSVRSATRGLGPAKRAATAKAELLRPRDWGTDPVGRRGPLMPGLMAAIGILWLLRGGELAAVLGEQAWINEEARTATISLAATKTDPSASGCERVHMCSCGRFSGPCGFCDLREVLRYRQAMGWGPKDPLFPTRQGRAPTSKTVIRALRKVLALPGATEHTLRRMGAQLLARRGLHLYLIQFFGRWGGAAVKRYVEEELGAQTIMRAAYSASTGGTEGASGPLPVGVEPPPFPSWGGLKREVLRLVRSALASQKSAPGDEEGRAVGRAIVDGLVAPVAAICGGPVLPFKTVRPAKDGRESGDRHEVIASDPLLPRELWVTRCGWRFAGSPHAVSGGGEVTCGRCRKLAVSGGGARRPAVAEKGGNG